MLGNSEVKVYKDARFSDDDGKSFEVAIMVNHQKCSAIVYDAFENRYVAYIEKSLNNYLSLSELELEIDSFFQHSFFSVRFVIVKVMYVTHKSTLIPEPLFEKSKMRELLSFNHDVDSNEDVFEYFIRNGLMYCVFAYPQWFTTLVQKHFKNCTFTHQSVPLINTVLLVNKHKALRKKVYVNVEVDFFDIVVIHGDSLLFANSFSYSHTNDFLYFLLNVFEQLKLNPEVNDVIFMGQVWYDSEFLIEAKKFIKNIHLVSYKDEQEHFSYVFQDLTLVQLSTLINVFRCA